MISAKFTLSAETSLTDFLRSFEPQFMNRYCENHMKAAEPALYFKREEELINQADKLAHNINDTYCRPNFGKHMPIMCCTVTEEDGENQLRFMLPVSKIDFVSIKCRPDRTVFVEWPKETWRDLATMMARLVLANHCTGRVILNGMYEVSWRAALIVCLIGPDMCGPFIDMAQDGLFEDYPPCESSTLKPAFGLKKKSKGTFLEL